MSKRIGFDRIIRIEWLDATAGKMISNRNLDELKDFLHDLLRNEHASYEARRKSIGVLLRIWNSVPEEHKNIRDRALKLLEMSNISERKLIHWGMVLLAFPFFRDTTKIINRLFTVQDEFHISQVSRKLIETWGERTTMIRAAQRIIRSICFWGLIKEGNKKGEYRRFQRVEILNREVVTWFLEAALTAEEKDFFYLSEILNMPTMFPFSLIISETELLEIKLFEVSQQDLNKTILQLK